MRKSTRETRKPQLYAPNGGAQAVDRVAPSDDESEGEVSGFYDQPKRKRTKTAAKTAAIDDTTGDIDVHDVNTLFGRVSKTNKFDNEITSWIDQYKTNRVAGMATLMNFLLMAAGAKKEWIASDVDLEALEGEEIETLLGDMLASMTQTAAKQYPLIKAKGGLRGKISKFLIELVDALHYLKGGRGVAINGLDVIRRLQDHLVAFSSLAVMNIRDVMTEAALSVGDGLIAIGSKVKEQLRVAEQQATSERAISGENSAKYKAHVADRTGLSKELNIIMGYLENIFTAVYLRRSKDMHEEVRLTAVHHLERFIRFDKAQPLKPEYLKYLRDVVYDFSNQVRLDGVEIVKSLVQDLTLISHLLSTVEHFADRFIDIASNDIDPTVALTMIEALRIMQKHTFLDNIESEKLALVDAVVFDADAGAPSRAEALRFLMDHTEGFEEWDAAKEGLVHKKGSKEVLLAKARNTAMQLVTLTEFAELHLEAKVESVQVQSSYLLAEACLATEKAYILYEWPTVISLLTEATLTTQPLRPTQELVLLHLLVHTAEAICAAYNDMGGAPKKGRAAAQDAAMQGIATRYDTLQQALNTSYGALLSRYSSTPTEVLAISKLLGCLSTPKKELVDKMVTLYSSASAGVQDREQAEGVEKNIAKALSTWMSKGGMVKEKVTDLIEDVLGRLSTVVDALNDESRGPKRKKAAESKEDLLFDLAAVLDKALVLHQTFDISSGDFAIDATQDTLIAQHETILTAILLPAASAHSISSAVQAALTRAAFSSLTILSSMLLWMMNREVLQGTEEEVLDAEVVAKVLALRDKIESIAIECMTPPTGCLAGIAYKTITDMLMLFPARFTNFPAAAALAYTPSGVLLTCLKEVFDQAPASDEVLETLLPLARHIYHDPTRANRRSAAAILSYLVHPSEDVQAAVKAVMRKLKEEETRFFEIQMLALRGVYMDEVLPHILARRAAEESGEDYNYLAGEKAEKAGYDKLSTLSRRFVHYLSLGKGPTPSVVQQFFLEGLTYALRAIDCVGFVEGLSAYVRLLPSREKNAVQRALVSYGAGLKDEVDAATAQGVNHTPQEVQRLLAFVEVVEGSGGEAVPLARKRASPGARTPSVAPASAASAASSPPKRRRVAKPSPQPRPSTGPTPTEVRRSTRATKLSSYEEEEDEDMDQEDRDMDAAWDQRIHKQTKAKKPSPAPAPAPRRSAEVSMGLDIEDIEEDEEEVRGAPVYRRGLVGPTPTPTSAGSAVSPRKRDRSSSSTPVRGPVAPFALSPTSPVASPTPAATESLDVSLDAIPSRRKLLSYGGHRG